VNIMRHSVRIDNQTKDYRPAQLVFASFVCELRIWCIYEARPNRVDAIRIVILAW